MKLKFLLSVMLLLLLQGALKTIAEEKINNQEETSLDCKYSILKPLQCIGKDKFFSKGKKKSINKVEYKKYEKLDNDRSKEISFYTGTFDVIDKEGDDQTNLFGLEHRNTNLFRDTFLGKISPLSGVFMTGKSSMYFYTGVEANYELGPLTLKPSFAPGYYEAGDGKDLGNVLEFKSEIKLDFNLFKNSKLGYSYSHISNNDWGTINPGVNNETFSFTKSF